MPILICKWCYCVSNLNARWQIKIAVYLVARLVILRVLLKRFWVCKLGRGWDFWFLTLICILNGFWGGQVPTCRDLVQSHSPRGCVTSLGGRAVFNVTWSIDVTIFWGWTICRRRLLRWSRDRVTSRFALSVQFKSSSGAGEVQLSTSFYSAGTGGFQCNSRAFSMQLLSNSSALSEQYLSNSQSTFSVVLEPFWSHFRVIVEQFQCTFRALI